jgi:hypothetical protein
MLDQIERLMTAMREVTDDVAHDLTTTLSRLRAPLELALIGPADAVDLRNVRDRDYVEAAQANTEATSR